MSRASKPPFDEKADADEQMTRLGILRVSTEYFQVGPYRYATLADAKAQAERDRAAKAGA